MADALSHMASMSDTGWAATRAKAVMELPLTKVATEEARIQGEVEVSSGKWASQLAGAWIANIFKKKGDEQEVDAWRGVQVGSHVATVLTGYLQPHIAPQLRKCAGPDQYAGPSQGTTIANHTLRTFRDVATLQKWSTAIVYLDLSNAFDKACREMVLGWPGLVEMSVERGTQLLRGFGFDEKSSGAIATRVCTKRVHSV